MDADLKAKWIAALRSGEYRQTQQGCLREALKRKGTSYSYCCLGVLADISGIGAWSGEELLFKGRPMNGYLYATNAESACDVLGLHRDTTSRLGRMNDNGKSFAEIADYIEAHL